MAYDKALAERTTDMLTACRASFEIKAMMGGLCYLVNGKMCVGVVRDLLMVRLDPAIEKDALAEPGCRPMDFTGRPMKGFVFVSPEGHDSDNQLRHWINLALRFNPRAVPSMKRRRASEQSR